MIVKLIGGRHDGRILNAPDGLRQIHVPVVDALIDSQAAAGPGEEIVDLSNETYDRVVLRVAGTKRGSIIVFVHESYTNEGLGPYEIIRLLIDGYRECGGSNEMPLVRR